MRLLLSGGGESKDVIHLDEYFAKQIGLKGIVLYIPVAMEKSVYSYAQCFDWFSTTYNYYGIKNIEICTNLSSIKTLDQYTAVFIGGGNTFKLLNEIKKSKFDVKIIDYINNDGFVYGGSAGAIIFGSCIKSAYYNDVNNVDLKDINGLNLAGGKDIWCHYSEKDNNYIENYPNDLFILYEESGLIIQDNKIQSIGKMYLNKNDILTK